MLPNDRVHDLPAEFCTITKPIAIIDKVKEVDVAPIRTIESTDSNIVFRVL